MYEYHCYWQTSNAKHPSVAVVESLHEVKDGFWLTRDYEYTRSEGAVYWIPSSRISYVKKVALPF
jgi:hypothetical protein